MIRILFISIFFSLFEFIALSQNEAFHGGIADGFGYQSSTAINMSQVGFIGNNLTVTVNQASGQSDPASQEPVLFTVVFSENVTDFDISDIVITGSANPQNIAIIGSGANYTIQLSGIVSNGDIGVNIPQGGIHNSVGNPNQSATSLDNVLIYNGIPMSVKIKLADGQPLISNLHTVHYAVNFSESVNDFIASDVSFSGTAVPSAVNITGSGKTYDVAVSGMANDGTVVITIPADKAHNNLGSPNTASVNTQNTITCDYTNPTVQITYSNGQQSPSLSGILKFDASFSESIQSLQAADIQLSGTAGATSIAISEHLNIFTISVSGMTQQGTVIVSIDANKVFDIAGNGNMASVNIQNEIIYQNIEFAVEITLPIDQKKYTNGNTARFNIHFNRTASDFDVSDISISGSGHANISSLTGSGSDYLLTLSGINSDGNFIINLYANKVHDEYNNTNTASVNTDNEIVVDTKAPFAQIDLEHLQSNPTNKPQVTFVVTFSEEIEDFTSEDVQLAGTAGSGNMVIQGSGTVYKVIVSGMNQDGDISITIPINSFKDLAGNFNTSTVIINNVIYYDKTNPYVEITKALNQADPAMILPLNFHVEFSEDVLEFGADRISFGGSTGVYLVTSGSGKSYNVAVFGVQTNETILIYIPAAAVHDLAGNPNNSSVNTSNSITYIGLTSVDNIDASKKCSIYFANGNINVEFTTIPGQNSKVNIYDIQGKLIFSKAGLNQLNQFPVGNLNSIYLIKVLDGKTQNNKMIVPFNY